MTADLPGALLVILAAGSAAAGTLGGLGGALFLVPLLVVLGVDPLVAAPLGAVSVAAGSLASAPSHLASGLVHQRLGVTVEIPASLGAIGGALAADRVSAQVLSYGLAAVALVAAVLAARSTGTYNPPRAEFAGETPGEWPGTLSGAYRLGSDVVPYQARHVGRALGLMGIAGVVSGLAGVGGGFIKTPTMREVMRVPVKVAAATTTFTVGVTASVSLLVFAAQGRLDVTAAAAVSTGGILGGLLGSRVSRSLAPLATRRVLAVLLVVVALVLAVRG